MNFTPLHLPQPHHRAKQHSPHPDRGGGDAAEVAHDGERNHAQRRSAPEALLRLHREEAAGDAGRPISRVRARNHGLSKLLGAIHETVDSFTQVGEHGSDFIWRLYDLAPKEHLQHYPHAELWVRPATGSAPAIVSSATVLPTPPSASPN